MKQVTEKDLSYYRAVPCTEQEAEFFTVTPAMRGREVDNSKLDNLLESAEVTAEVAAEVLACADRDWDYGNFAENFWNAAGQGGYPHCSTLARELREQASGDDQELVAEVRHYYRRENATESNCRGNWNEKGSWGL